MTMPPLGDWTFTHGVDNTVETPEYRAIDEVRLLIADTDPNLRLLADYWIAYEINQWLGAYTPTDFTTTPPTIGFWQAGPYDHPLMAAHACALRISNKFAGVVTIEADGVTVEVGDLQGKYAQMAAALKAEYDRYTATGGDVDYSNLLWCQDRDWEIRPTTFGIGMNDNILAGQQDYGGLQDWPGGDGDGGYSDDVSVP